jgi:uncharacterized MAPEG superfamily protein
MTIAFWTILAAALLPILSAGIAKGGDKTFDNAAPRAWLDAQSGWRRRANWAQQNHLEAFPPFAAAVLVAGIAGAPQHWADALAVAFVVLRVGYRRLCVRPAEPALATVGARLRLRGRAVRHLRIRRIAP